MADGSGVEATGRLGFSYYSDSVALVIPGGVTRVRRPAIPYCK